jgi:ACS family glucarate transporter-like MFS transporter
MSNILRPSYRQSVMVLLFFLILITYLDRITISVVAVRIKAAFHLTNTQFGWALSAFVLAYALFEIPTGLMGDRLGQRKVLLRIVIWWSVFTVLTGAVNGLTSLIAIRFLFGAGEAGAYPNSCGVISRWMPGSETSRGMSWLGMGGPAGAALAPLIVVPIASVFGWRAPFFVNGVLGLLWVLVCWLWFRNHPQEMKGISVEEKELIEKNRNYVKNDHSFEWKLVIRNPILWALFVSYFSIQWANYFLSAWLPTYLQEGKHFSEQQMKTTTSLVFSAGIPTAFLFGIISDRLIIKKGRAFARKTIALVSFILMVLSVLASVLFSDPKWVTASFVFAEFSLVTIVLTCFSTCIDIGGDRVSTITGIMNFCGQTGAFLMSIIFGKLVDLTHSYEMPQYVMLIVLIIGGACWFVIDASKKLITDPRVSDFIQVPGII